MRPPAGESFPTTRHSILEATRAADPETRRRAFDALVAAYWKPVYKYVRLRWRASPEDAQDLTQGFFARAMEKGFFDRFDPARARFRTFVRVCLNGYVSNERAAAQRVKRGGAVTLVPLDFETAEGELRRLEPAAGEDLERLFHREWVRSVFGLAVEAMQERCAAAGKEIHFALFQRYDIEGPDLPARPTYAELAEEHGVAVTQVTNWLAWARREFRRTVLERLRELTGGEEEFRAEVRELLGFDPAPSAGRRGTPDA